MSLVDVQKKSGPCIQIFLLAVSPGNDCSIFLNESNIMSLQFLMSKLSNFSQSKYYDIPFSMKKRDDRNNQNILVGSTLSTAKSSQT